MGSKKKSIVFGGSGFIGSHVADELSRIGHEVVIYDISESEFCSDNQEMIIGDLLDEQKIYEVTKDVNYVFNFAGIADIGYARNNPKETYSNNVLGTLNILNACKKNQVERFIFASTIYVYSNLGSFYRASKQACELLITTFQKEHKLPYTILRFGSLYGPRSNQFNFINNAITEALENGVITRKGSGNEKRDYIHVNDAARAAVLSLNQEYSNQCVMIKGTQTMRVNEILMTLQEMLEDTIEIHYTNEEHYDAHYSLTPFSFRPQIAKQIQLDSYYDLGQGLHDCLYEIYQALDEEKKSK
ncbi:MAG: NAD-dependent epimerase [Flavobacteriales bacterium]|nr:NAD-dependent epimerase [Flavobacteriales bacterium]